MNLPNKITLTRIMLIPVFVLFFYLDEVPYHLLIAAAVFAIAASTDFLDGHIARSRNLVTSMGKFLDPIADKVLNSTAFILLLTRPDIFCETGTWGFAFAGVCVALIMARDLIIDGFRLVAVEKHTVIAADKLGKFKTVMQDLVIGYLLIASAFLYDLDAKVLCVIAIVLLGVTMLLTVVSGANYIVRNRQVLKEEEKD